MAIPPRRDELRVGMVARCLNTPHIRGMGRYVYELLHHSAVDKTVSWRVFGNDERHPVTVPPHQRLDTDVFPFRGDRYELWEQIGVPMRCRASNLSLVHHTEGTLPLWQPVPTVVTVHDTILWEERDGRRFTSLYLDRILPGALRRCAGVITISESSRRDILARWPELERKLWVIPHGISDLYFEAGHGVLPAELADWLGGRRYIVYLGGPAPRKRFDWVLRILERNRPAGLCLIACGFGGEAREAAERSLAPEIRDRVRFAPYLEEEQLMAVYRTADAALYPTLYEGFGFPVIEAQASGTPILFSKAGSLEELVGPLSYLLPEHDLEAWCEAVESALSMSSQERSRKAEEARLWARRYRWSESWARHRQVYAAAVAGGDVG